MRRKYIPTLEEFRNIHQPLLESIGDGLQGIPGFQNLTIKLNLNDIVVITSQNKLFTFSLTELNDTATEDELNVDTSFLSGLKCLYDDLLKARYTYDFSLKFDVVSRAEEYELFDVSFGSFFTDLDNDLRLYGGDAETILAIRTNLQKLYDNTQTLKMSQNANSLLNKYLNDLCEFVAAKIYAFFLHINQENLILRGDTSSNNDLNSLNESEHFIEYSPETNRYEERFAPRVSANRNAAIRDISLMVQEACQTLGLIATQPLDYDTNRPASGTSTYIYFVVENYDFIIKAVLNPVEMRRLNLSEYTFWVESNDTIYGRKELKSVNSVEALSELITEFIQ